MRGWTGIHRINMHNYIYTHFMLLFIDGQSCSKECNLPKGKYCEKVCVRTYNESLPQLRKYCMKIIPRFHRLFVCVVSNFVLKYLRI